MSVSDKIKNRGAHGDSSFMLGRLHPSSENRNNLCCSGGQLDRKDGLIEALKFDMYNYDHRTPHESTNK